MCLPRREELKSVRSLIKAKDGAVRFCGVEMPPKTVDGLRAVRRAAFAASQLTEESCRSLRMFGLVEPALGASSGEGADAMRDGASLKLTVLGALLLRVLERPEAIREDTNTTVFPADPAVYALEASAAIALSRLFADRREETLAIELAFQAGYASYPNPEPSPLVAGDIALAKNWKAGWGQREHELRPLTREDLQAKIREMSALANQGCGQFYELYEQRFTSMVDGWLPDLRDGERAVALELLKGEAYSPDADGHWAYDAEENDIHFVPKDGAR